MDGILNINKPREITSYGIVARVKRLIGERRVGHAGTLDPLAEGVLPVCFGRATRVIEFLAGSHKTYRAGIELGTVTDTYDAGGKIISQRDPSGISQSDLLKALSSFKGTIEQTPPMYSAVKYKGQPLYRLARAGIEIERKSRPAEIYSLELIDWQWPVATIDVVCGKGTYIRSIAHDLGQLLGCGAYLKSLVRLKYGPFDIGDALSLERLEDIAGNGYWWHFVYPVDSVLLDWAAMILNQNKTQRVINGQPLDIEKSNSLFSGRCRAYSLDGCFLGVLRFLPESKQWRSEKVFI